MHMATSGLSKQWTRAGLLSTMQRPHLNVSGAHNTQADYANWGYWVHCDATMAPSWLSWALWACYPSPFRSFPQAPFQKQPILCSLFRGLIIGSAVNKKVKGHGRGSAWSIPPPAWSISLSFHLHQSDTSLHQNKGAGIKRTIERDRGRKRKRESKQVGLSEQIPKALLFSLSLTLSRTRTLMSGVRHHDAPAMPWGLSVFAPYRRGLAGDWALCLHSDQFLMALTPTQIYIGLPVSLIGAHSHIVTALKG